VKNEGNVIGNQPRKWHCNDLHMRQVGGRKPVVREHGRRFQYKLGGN